MSEYTDFRYPRENQIFQFLSKDANGDQTNGNINANGNYSVTPEKFFIKPPVGELWVIIRMLVEVQDTGVFRAEGYGSSLSPLTNGINVYRNIDGDVSDYLVSTSPIEHNAKWGSYCYDVDVKSWGAGDEVLLARWTFEKSGRAMALDGDIGEELGVALNDDFTFLVDQYFHVQGFKIIK